jgi:hypothetical protein
VNTTEELSMKIRVIALAALLFAAAPGTAARADDALASALEKVSKDQIAAFNREDAAATLAHSYTKSPAYDTAKEGLPGLFADADARAEQVSFRYIGHDDEFAVARAKVKVTAANAPGFENNTVDVLMIFHQEGGAWKVWDSYLLGSEPTK